MKKLIPYLAFTCLAMITATSVLPVMAGGCNNQMNKTAKIKCADDDIDCQSEKAEMLNLKNSVKS